MPSLALRSAVRTDVGPVRPQNEDAVFASERMVAVADGVGGRAAGEVASALVVNELVALDKRIPAAPLPDALADAILAGNDALAFVASCRPESAGMSTTLTTVALDGGGFVVASIGDSRAYLLRDGVLTRLTRDDSLVQELVDGGHLTPREARAHPHRNVVLAALDGEAGRRAVISASEARAGDRLLVCSDGLSDVVDDDAIARALAIPDRDEAADRLLALALDGGARDNVSVIVTDAVRATCRV